MFVGTSDNERPLPNDANLRRFVPVYLDSGYPELVRIYLSEQRDNLWAEAVHEYRGGIEARLPDELKAAQTKATDMARSGDVMLEDAVDKYLADAPAEFVLAQAAKAINIIGSESHGAMANTITERKLINVLRLRGYKSTQVREGTRRVRLWAKVG